MTDKYDLIVIGGGSAGLVAAGGAALLGARVALVEKNLLGGDCLYTGCVPSKTLIRSARYAAQLRRGAEFGFENVEPRFSDDSFAAVTKRVQRVIGVIEEHDAPHVFEEMGVEVVFGTPTFVTPHELEVVLKDGSGSRRMVSRRFCLATGSRPAVPPIDGLADAGFITNEEVFHLTELPPRLVVLGAGAIGLELGQSFARFGSKVTMIEAGPRIMSREDADAAAFLSERLRAEGVEIHTLTKVVGVSTRSGEKIVKCEHGGSEFEIVCDEILVAAGRRPNVENLGLETAGVKFDRRAVETDDFLRTSQSHIYAAGDITGHYQFTHMADYEAQVVIQNAFLPRPLKKKTDFRVVPWATFTEPEVGRVGLTAAEAEERFGSAVKVYRVDFSHNDRAQAEGAADGFAKVVTRNGEIIGATIVGEHAGETIHEFVWAMKQRLKISQLGGVIRIYPTLAKIVQATGTEATLETLRSPFVQKWFARYLKIWRR
jgi:pyruvate/2-oxoglutarate dehydrogenase complex dihydrolipoamide dehydrogenase (E3) component